jgi:two-component system sensor histidine kinase/response regulator
MRRAFRFVVILVVVLAAMGAAAYFWTGMQEREHTLAGFEPRMKAMSQLRADVLSRYVNHMRSNIRFLATLPSLYGLVRAAENQGFDAEEQTREDLWRSHLQSIFHGFVANNEEVTQVRFIGLADGGRELVRVDRRQGKIIDLPTEQLQEKGVRYFVQETAKLAKGQVYISDIALNRDVGKIEQPYVPTMRAATPIFGSDGKLFGMVVINVDARFLMAELKPSVSSNFQVYLTNEQGDFLLHPDATRTFGFDLGRRWRWQDEFRQVENNNGKKSELRQFVSANGLNHVLTRQVMLDQTDPSRYLTVAILLSDAAIAQTVVVAQYTALLFMLGGGLLVGGLIYVFQQQLRKLHEHQAKLGAIVESAQDAIIGKTLDGIVTSWNKGAERIFGYTEQEAIGKTLLHLIVPVEFTDEEKKILAHIRRGEVVSSYDTVRHRKDGSTLHVSISVSPIQDLYGRVVGASKSVRDISKQKAAEAEILQLNRSLEQQVANRTVQIREVSSLQRAILNSAGYAIIATDITGMITVFNPAAESLLGYRADEAIGKLNPGIFHEPSEVVERAAVFSEELKETIEPGFDVFVIKSLRGLPNEHEWTFVRKDGSLFPVRLSITALKYEDGSINGYLGMAVDLTEPRKAENALKASSRFLQMLADNMPNMVGYWDMDLYCKFANYAYRDWFGKTPEQMQGIHLQDFMGETFHKSEPYVRAVLRGEPQRFERTVTKLDGGEGHIWANYIPDIADGQMRGFIVMVTDVTELKQKQLDIAALNQKLEIRTTEAEAASRAKSDFVANMSHEIRTPMNAVLGMTHLLSSTPLSAEQRKYADMIRASGESLLTILNDILDFSKIEAGKMELEPKEFLLEETLKVLGTIMTISAGEKELELAIGVGAEVPNGLVGDSLRLQQILTNLVSNAIKFTQSGEVILTVQLAEKRAHGVVLRFEIRDSGIGITEEQQRKLFYAFTQADSSTTRRFGGTGLGLTICKRLVELMGGSIGVVSQAGVGSRFWFTLPFDRSAEPDSQLHKPTMGQLSILLADDNPTSLGFLRELIAAWGWQVDCVSTGDLAVEYCRQRMKQGKLPYDIVILDLQMPGKDGIATLRQIKLNGQHEPIILMTNGRGRKQLAAAGGREHVDAVLVKPVTASNLFDAINEAFTRKKIAGKMPPEQLSATSDRRLGGLRILLVEDNHYNQIVGRGLLENAGATVRIAGDGSQAVEILRTSYSEFDVVLMDIQMPVMDGFEATQLIREELKLGLPILAMTAGVMVRERDRCINAGMNDFIAKPIDVEKMLSVLVRYLPLPASNLETASGSDAVSEAPSGSDSKDDDNSKILDIDSLLEACPKSGDFQIALAKMIQRVCDEGMQTVADIRNAWQSGKVQDAMQLLHKARGGIGTLGAQRFSNLALKMEQAMGKGLQAEVESGMPLFEREMALVIASAADWLQRQEKSDERQIFPLQLDRAALEQLRAALLEQKMTAVDLYRSMKPTIATVISDLDLQILDKAINELEFDRAGKILAQISS